MSENWDISTFSKWKAEDFPLGAVCLESGNSSEYVTGGWRSERPIWDIATCKQCLLCWMHCPDSSILVTDGKMTGIDYDHCKGCGVCVHECKFGCLSMKLEADIEEEA